MESSNNTTPLEGTSNEVKLGKDTNYYLCKIQCCIRRKPNMVALPGQDPAERIYRIGASLDRRTQGNLKGIAGDLELKFMPEIIGVGHNDPTFRRSVEEYWSSIGKAVPADEPFLRDHEKGIKIDIQVRILSKTRKEKVEKIARVEDKMQYINELLVYKNPEGMEAAILDFDSFSDYLLLNYCLKYSKVANNFEDIDKSPKIDFYIFEKSVSVKTQTNAIATRNKAMKLYQTLEDDSRKIDAILLMFGEDLRKFEDDVDKLLRIDELYNTAPIDNMNKFIAFAEDSDWEIKYLIKLGIAENKLRTPANTTAIYYGDMMIGVTLDEAVHFLTKEEKGKQIQEDLKREINANN